jgi:hypothetical protein
MKRLRVNPKIEARRALCMPELLFRDAPAKLVTHYLLAHLQTRHTSTSRDLSSAFSAAPASGAGVFSHALSTRVTSETVAFRPDARGYALRSFHWQFYRAAWNHRPL